MNIEHLSEKDKEFIKKLDKTSPMFGGLKQGDYYIDLGENSIWYNEVVLCVGFEKDINVPSLAMFKHWGLGKARVDGKTLLWGGVDGSYRVLSKEEIALIKLKK